MYSTVASAVVMPEPSEAKESSPTLKRRQSSLDSTEAKRPKFTETSQEDSRSPPAAGANASDRSRGNGRRNGAVEERKRGQRLFGAILGTLSQSSPSAGQRKRQEVEKKQLDKLKLRHEEDEERKKHKREELLVTRRKQQKVWDEEGMRLRHRNMLAMAHFLKTKTTPPLYYKPWEMRSEEDSIIQQQISDTQDIIDREVAKFEDQRHHEDKEEADIPMGDEQKPTEQVSEKVETQDHAMDGVSETEPAVTNTEATMKDSVPPAAQKSEVNGNGVHAEHAEEPAATDDHGGEELVEGQEDDVIY